MKRLIYLYLLLITLSVVFISVIIYGKHLMLLFVFPPHPAESIDQTTPETKEAIRRDKIRDSLFEAERSTYFGFMQEKKYDTHVAGYEIVRTHDIVDSTYHVYSLVISRNDSIKFRTGIGVDDSNRVSYVLYSLIPNGRKQVIIEEHTGGAHCCRMYWILDLADTVHVLYHSDENDTEIGSMGRIYDFDNDGRCEFIQILNSFHYFDKLCGACSPAVDAIFKYSDSHSCFRVANREFPSIILEDIEKKKSNVKQFLDTTKVFNQELSTVLLGITLDVLIHYVYAGQDSIGWAYFDRNYIRPDKAKMKNKIQAVLNASVIYRQLYPDRLHYGVPDLTIGNNQ